jgi:RHS repeat-associated protein
MTFAEGVSTSQQPYKYGGKELETNLGINLYDFEARTYAFDVPRFTTMDPLAEKYYSVSPYAYVMNNPMILIDPMGEAWRLKHDMDVDGVKPIPVGFEWVEEGESSENKRLKTGLYAQAIFFSHNGNFVPGGNNNIGTSTATVYLADGSTQTFKASTYPSDISHQYATVPEGFYHATFGKHNGSKGSYDALRMSDTNNSGRIELGTTNPNPDYKDGRTYAENINIHKPGKNNETGMIRGNPISAGCLLIDRTDWDRFINIFDNDIQRKNTVGIIVSRSRKTPK